MRRVAGAASRIRLTAAVIVLALAVGCTPAPPRTRVAAASDLQFALQDIADRFAAETGDRVDVVFGSSGMLARQIQDGAPFEIFLSADESFVDMLSRGGLTRDAGVLYGVGRIVLFAPYESPLVRGDGLGGLQKLVASGQIPRVAIANPEHAPYGRAAEQALRQAMVWDALRPSLVLGENVSQAAQFATTGNAAGGIIALSLALAPAMQERGTHALIAAEDHDPLRQRMVLLAGAGPVGARFYRYLQEPAARGILERYGFGLPK